MKPGAAQDAVCRGTFQNNPGGGGRSSVVLQSALEIASAMAFLHSHGIVHGVRLRSPLDPTNDTQSAHPAHMMHEQRTFTMQLAQSWHLATAHAAAV